MADALDSKSSDRKIVWVQVPPPAGFPASDGILQNPSVVVFLGHDNYSFGRDRICFVLPDVES
jgi:hypothetical protein